MTFEPRGDRTIIATRTFQGTTSAALFAALTTPTLLQRWLLGPPGWEMPVCEVDLCVGGRYRYGWACTDDDRTMAVGGAFVEVLEPHGFTATERFEGPFDQGETLITYALADTPSGTVMTLVLRYPSQPLRDAVAASGMERGLAASFDRLARLLLRDDVCATLEP